LSNSRLDGAAERFDGLLFLVVLTSSDGDAKAEVNGAVVRAEAKTERRTETVVATLERAAAQDPSKTFARAGRVGRRIGRDAIGKRCRAYRKGSKRSAIWAIFRSFGVSPCFYLGEKVKRLRSEETEFER
jgi:hypothetical protein